MGSALIEECKLRGIELGADGNGLTVEPAYRLTEQLRSRLQVAKPELMALLQARAQEQERSGKRSGKDIVNCMQIESSAGYSELLRWPQFVASCISRGVTRHQVESMFTEEDIADLCEEPDYKLPKHAATIASAIKRTSGNSPTVEPAQRIQPVLVRCGDCQYFECNEQHPDTGLGSCAARLDIKMGIPARRMECIDYELKPLRLA